MHYLHDMYIGIVIVMWNKAFLRQKSNECAYCKTTKHFFA